jgi:predicted Zn-dependent protease
MILTMHIPTWLLAAFALAVVPARVATPDLPPPSKDDPEVKIATEAHAEMARSGLKLVNDPALQGRVEGIGRKLAAIANKVTIPATYGADNKTAFEYKFFVVDDPDVNAFALPAGYIYVNRGLLKYVQSDDELAGVLGHEIIHAAHHHVLRLQKEQERLNTQLALGAIAAIIARVPAADTGNLVTGLQLVGLQKVNGYSQMAERDADLAGLELARQAGYNVVGALTFMERLARDQRNRPDVDLGIFRTHPPEKERVANLLGAITKLGVPIQRRKVAQMLKVEVKPAGAMTEVLLDGRLYLRTNKPERAKSAADVLDRFLDSDVQLYEFSNKNNRLLARGMVLLVPEPGDDDPGILGKEGLVDRALKTVRAALFKYALDGQI